MPCYLVNRSKLLEEVLRAADWDVCDDLDGAVDFAMWDPKTEPHLPVPPRARLKPFVGKELILIDNKRRLWKALKDHAPDLLPETYLAPFNAPETDEEPGKSRVWFLKKAHTAGGKDILCGPLDELRAAWTSAEKPTEWLLQRGVPSMLIDGCKNTLRLYTLMLPDKSVYFHKDGLLIVHKKPYSEETEDLDREVHVDHTGCTRTPLRDHPEYDSILTHLREAVRRVFVPYQEVLNADGDATRYHLFGFDFIITPAYTPVLIEVNQYPNLSIRSDPVGREIKRTLFEDMYSLMIAPTVLGVAVATGGFEKVL